MNSYVEQHCIEWNNRILHSASSYYKNSISSSISTSALSSPGSTTSNNTKSSCHFVAGMYQNEFYFINSKAFVCSTHNEIFLLILRYLHCSITFKNSQVNYGGRKENGTWTGILSLFDRKEADFIPHIFSSTNSRDTIIYYKTLLPAKESITVLSSMQYTFNESPWNIFASFSLQIWLFIGLFYILYGMLNFVDLIRISRKRYCTVARLLSNYVEIFALLLGQGTVTLTNHPRNFLRNPLILWVIFAFIIRTLFANDITAILLSQGQFKFDYFTQLHQMSKSMKILIVEKSSSYFNFKSKFPELMTRTENIAFEEYNSMETLRKVLYGRYVMITPREFGDMIQSYYSTVSFYVSKEGFYSSLGNFAIRHGLSEVTSNKLSRLWRDIFAFGLNYKIDKTIVMSNLLTSLRHNRTSLEQLTSNDAENVSKQAENSQSFLAYVYIYLIGIAVSLFAFAVEFAVHHLRCLTERKLYQICTVQNIN